MPISPSSDRATLSEIRVKILADLFQNGCISKHSLLDFMGFEGFKGMKANCCFIDDCFEFGNNRRSLEEQVWDML
jgi:hypothetical protein